MVYRPEHLSFIAKGLPITSVEQCEDEEHIKIIWEDHTSTFNSSWLRTQDVPATLKLREPFQEVRWDSGVNIPRYDYGLKDDQFESWMTDLKSYGMIIVDGTPPTQDGMVDFMHTIGPLRQLYEGTNVLTWTSNLVVDDQSAPMHAHTNTSYYRAPPKIQVFLCTEYDAPKEDTLSFFVDGFKVVDDFRKEDPEAFKLLASTVVRQARRRSESSNLHNYEWDTFQDNPLVITEGDKLKQLLVTFNEHAAYPLKDQSDEHMKDWYRAILMLQERLDDPKNHHSSVMKKGTMVVMDNHRICHGRGTIHSATSHTLLGCNISGEVWESRWRLMLAKKSGLPDEWLLGCSTESLEILANRNN